MMSKWLNRRIKEVNKREKLWRTCFPAVSSPSHYTCRKRFPGRWLLCPLPGNKVPAVEQAALRLRNVSRKNASVVNQVRYGEVQDVARTLGRTQEEQTVYPRCGCGKPTNRRCSNGSRSTSPVARLLAQHTPSIWSTCPSEEHTPPCPDVGGSPLDSLSPCWQRQFQPQSLAFRLFSGGDEDTSALTALTPKCVHFQILGLSSGKTIASWKPGYVVIFNLITGKVKFVSENYTANYTSLSSGCDCHVAANTNEVSHKTCHFRAFEWSQYYLYELSGSTVTEQPGQLCPYAVVAFQYREPKRMAVAAQKSVSLCMEREVNYSRLSAV
ncbi:uncharacterized protein [Manis javanica]|uniref:uncharacterized protein isoform X2 n=1 Tax=Manis javanica TaxID=9974 RepID=UPI003C6CF546